jgi:hypothetical protein
VPSAGIFERKFVYILSREYSNSKTLKKKTKSSMKRKQIVSNGMWLEKKRQ